MANVIAVTQSASSLAAVQARFGLRCSEQNSFFTEWQDASYAIRPEEEAALSTIYRRSQYHRADSEPLEGAVMLLIASPLLELAGLYDPPYKLKSEATVEITLDDGEEILRERIDALVLQDQLWVLVLEAKKTTIPLRSALPQLLTYLMANAQPSQPVFGLLTNGDEILFVKLGQEPSAQYDLSRAFSLYTLNSELTAAFKVLKQISQTILPD